MAILKQRRGTFVVVHLHRSSNGFCPLRIPENESLSILGTIAHLVIDCPRSCGQAVVSDWNKRAGDQTIEEGGKKKRREKILVQTCASMVNTNAN